MCNTLLDSEENIFPVKHIEFVFDVLTNIPQFFEPSINENFICIFGKYINKYKWQIKESFISWRGENFIRVNENLMSYFPAHAYNDINGLAE